MSRASSFKLVDAEVHAHCVMLAYDGVGYVAADSTGRVFHGPTLLELLDAMKKP